MDKITTYQNIINHILSKWTNYSNTDMPNVKYELLVDENKCNYILYVIGWHNNNYHHDWVYHLQIKGDKIWIHEDRTDEPIANVLIQKGIDQSAIVLGYMSPKILLKNSTPS